MCVEVRVTYPRCFHVHLGHELCNDFESDHGHCPKFETHRRIDPFCPSCSKPEYTAHRLQSARGLNAQQQQAAMTQTWQSHIFGKYQPQVGPDFSVGQQNGADNSKRPSLDSTISDSSSYQEIQSPNPHIPRPSPIEPQIDPGLLGPHLFLEYQQKLAMVVGDHRPRSGQKDYLSQVRVQTHGISKAC